MNLIAKDIRTNRQQFESIVCDFRVYWGKVYRGEVTKALADVAEQLKGDPKNDALKAERYALEQVCAKIKGTTLTDEIRDLIKQLHDEDKLTFSCLTADYIRTSLNGLSYVAEDGVTICAKKRIKGTDDYEWKPVEKWTESKVGRYFRMATMRINEQSK